MRTQGRPARSRRRRAAPPRSATAAATVQVSQSGDLLRSPARDSRRRPAPRTSASRPTKNSDAAAVGEVQLARIAVERPHALRPPLLGERREKPVLRLRGAGQAHRLGGEQEREVEGPRRRRECGEPVRIGHQEGLLGLPLGAHGEERGDQGDDEHRRQPGRQPPRPVPRRRLAVGSLLGGGQLGVGGLPAGRQELLLERRDVGARAVRPVEGGGQPGAAGELVVPPAAGLPLSGGGGEVTAHRAAGGVVLQPPDEPRPGGQQRLVRDLQPLAVHGEQPAVDEDLDDRRAGSATLTGQVQLRERQRAPHQRAAVVGVGQPDEQPAGEVLTVLVQFSVGGLGGPGQRTGDAPGLQVAGERQPVAAATFPGADQSGRQQRQRPRLAEDIGDHGVEQFGIDLQADRPRPARGRSPAVRGRSAAAPARTRRRAAP